MTSRPARPGQAAAAAPAALEPAAEATGPAARHLGPPALAGASSSREQQQRKEPRGQEGAVRDCPPVEWDAVGRAGTSPPEQGERSCHVPPLPSSQRQWAQQSRTIPRCGGGVPLRVMKTPASQLAQASERTCPGSDCPEWKSQRALVSQSRGAGRRVLKSQPSGITVLQLHQDPSEETGPFTALSSSSPLATACLDLLSDTPSLSRRARPALQWPHRRGGFWS